MSSFVVGQRVKMASHPELVFEIVAINADQSFEIQSNISSLQHLKYHHISFEMLRAVVDVLES